MENLRLCPSQRQRLLQDVQAQPTAPYAWILTQDRKFHFQGWNLIAEADPDKTFVRTYLWGLDLSGTFTGAGGTGGLLAVTTARGPAAGTHLVTTDGWGNVTGLINANTGQPSAAYTYDPFGQLRSATGTAAAEPIGFSTRYDATICQAVTICCCNDLPCGVTICHACCHHFSARPKLLNSKPQRHAASTGLVSHPFTPHRTCQFCPSFQATHSFPLSSVELKA